ncbi:hypothetical protein [Chitinolyticbacter albus]|uniref:hypothetical protein n=1 Tax=Chitinolyticbacter albus TaxID=2961951 RepID=UPI00210AEB6C|nr:hypothetical protein [Chitinolyticbacter albus]
MSLLDELKKQAQNRAVDDAEARALRAQRLADINASLRDVFNYLYELTEQLKVIRPANPYRYRIWGVGEWENLQFDKVAVDLRQKRVDEADHADTLEFAVVWLAAQPLKASYGSQSEANYLKDKLWNLGCRLEEKLQRTPEGRFLRAVITVEPFLPMRWRFEALHGEGNIRLTVRNLDDLREDIVVLTPAECTPALCEELARALLGQPNHAAQLLRR